MADDLESGDSKINFIPCVTWVRRGVAKPEPERVKLTKEELLEVIQQTKVWFLLNLLICKILTFSYFNCEHFFFIHCKPKKVRGLKKLEILIMILEPSLGSSEVPQKNSSDRFCRFYVCWIQTHERQTSKVY